MTLSLNLLRKAEQFKSLSPSLVALSHLKEAGLSEEDARIELAQDEMEKEAASTLVASGIDYDEALKMVKQAGVRLREIPKFKPEPYFEETIADEFIKVASEVQTLETQIETLLTKVAELEAVLDQIPEDARVPEAISKFASSGTFTNADLEELMKVPSETLQKVAAFNDSPWSMGKVSGRKTPPSDPLMDFILG